MNRLLIFSAFIVFTLVNTPSVAAYGGGGGFPPGYYGNPHVTHKLVCETVKKQLPFNREITIPSCKVVRVESKNKAKKDFKQRINDFLARFRNGNNN